MGLIQKHLEVVHGAQIGVNGHVVGHIVAVVAQRAGVEGQQPQAVHAQILQVVQFPGQARKIALAVAVAVCKGTHRQFIEDGAFVPFGCCWGGGGLRHEREFNRFRMGC